jgi:hypothetical protein
MQFFNHLDHDLQALVLLGGIWFSLLMFMLWLRRRRHDPVAEDYTDDTNLIRPPNGVSND